MSILLIQMKNLEIGGIFEYLDAGVVVEDVEDGDDVAVGERGEERGLHGAAGAVARGVDEPVLLGDLGLVDELGHHLPKENVLHLLHATVHSWIYILMHSSLISTPPLSTCSSLRSLNHTFSKIYLTRYITHFITVRTC